MPPPTDLRARDRRAGPRLRLSCPTDVLVFLPGSKRTLRGRLADLSARGCALLLPEPVPPGRRAWVRLRGWVGVCRWLDAELRACAAHATRDPEGGWRVGFRLLAPLGGVGLAPFLAAPAAAVATARPQPLPVTQ